MGFHETIADRHVEFINEQQLFFVATAPESGRVNLSPKGIDSFRVLGPNRVGYVDYTGSGNETAAHLRDNGRITFMFCSFGASPLILRLYGGGVYVRPDDPEYAKYASELPLHWSARQIIIAQIDSIQTSCGFGVPKYEYVGGRGQLVEWADKKGAEAVEAYWQAKNVESIDGLPTSIEPAT